MAGYAALRVGAGLVSIATHPDHAAMMDACNPELMCHGVNDEKDLKPLLEKADLVILGPGLGQTEWSKKVWKAAVNQNIPMLVDADALNLLAGAKMKKEDWVLTPHPGEAARLLGTSAETVQRDRLAAAHKIAQQYGGVAVLKGAGSLIVSADTLPVLCDKGNPGMATAGMGDVLSGVIGGFIAQGIPLSDAVKLGVMIHARAGDMAAKEGERGIVATDLMPFLRRLSNLAS